MITNKPMNHHTDPINPALVVIDERAASNLRQYRSAQLVSSVLMWATIIILVLIAAAFSL
jgi:hypothetical protein